jgi:hypothetical protein
VDVGGRGEWTFLDSLGRRYDSPMPPFSPPPQVSIRTRMNVVLSRVVLNLTLLRCMPYNVAKDTGLDLFIIYHLFIYFGVEGISCPCC